MTPRNTLKTSMMLLLFVLTFLSWMNNASGLVYKEFRITEPMKPVSVAFKIPASETFSFSFDSNVTVDATFTVLNGSEVIGIPETLSGKNESFTRLLQMKWTCNISFILADPNATGALIQARYTWTNPEGRILFYIAFGGSIAAGIFFAYVLISSRGYRQIEKLEKELEGN